MAGHPRQGLDVSGTHAFPLDGQQVAPGFDHAHWERLNDTQLGVGVVDPDGHQIGSASVPRSFARLDAGGWQPVDGRKHVLVGELDHYYFYNERLSIAPDEADFNLNIAPDEPFRFLLDDVVRTMSESDRGALKKRTRGTGYAVECEITPDQEYYDNWHFPTGEHDQCPLVGTRVGVYGPWVRDLDGGRLAETVGGNHGGRPEIHPCEVIWWNNGPVERVAAPRGRVQWTILVLQDDSNRFDRASQYDRPVPRPWSASPRRAHLTLALLARRGRQTKYFVDMRDGRRIFDWPGEEARSVQRDVGGQPVLTVSKRMSRRSEVKLRVSELSADPADSDLLRCFMTMDIQVGDGDNGKEGFAELSVEGWAPTEPSDDAPPSTPAGGRPPMGPARNWRQGPNERKER